MKICIDCKIEKDLLEFSKNGKYYRGQCKSCRSSKEIKKYHENPEKFRQKKKDEYINNQKEIIERNRLYRKNNSVKINVQKAEYREKNREIIQLKQKSKEYKDKRNKYLKIRRESDKKFCIISSYRSRISELLKNIKNGDSRLVYLDCSKKFFYDWIEYQFDENMSWDNYVEYWVLDHVIPISWFNLDDEIHRNNCFRWYNLRPLKKEDNSIKSNKFELSTIKKHQEIIDKWYQDESKLCLDTGIKNNPGIEIYHWLRKELRYGNNPHGYMDNQQPSS